MHRALTAATSMKSASADAWKRWRQPAATARAPAARAHLRSFAASPT
jgi:hypothetical protein